MNDIFVYAIDVSTLNPDSAVWAAFISAERRARMAALQRLDDRRRSLGAELALHAALSRHLENYAPPPAYLYTPGGKPVLADGKGWHVSLAHTGDWAVCALHGCEVGIDIERKNRVSTIPVREWVGMESYLKLTGTGLAGGFRALCATETEIFRLGQRVAYLARGEIGGCLLCAATDAPARLRVAEIDPLAFG